jgi:ankyrin repeat protein
METTRMNNEYIQTYLFQCIEKGDLNNFITTLDKYNPNILEYRDSNGCTVLIRSVFLDLNEISFCILDYIIKMPYEHDKVIEWINKRNTSGFNALHYAAFRGNFNVIKRLNFIGADICITNKNGLNLMHMAAQGNQASSLVYLKEYYDMDIKSQDAVNSTPLHWASYMNADIAFDYLVNWKADINAKDKDGSTPIHLAVMNGN